MVRIDGSGLVTLTFRESEMGQGISSALPMVLADELGVDWKDVRVEHAPNDLALFGDQGTGGSGSVAGYWTRLRRPPRPPGDAGHTAAQSGTLVAQNLHCEKRLVIHGADN